MKISLVFSFTQGSTQELARIKHLHAGEVRLIFPTMQRYQSNTRRRLTATASCVAGLLRLVYLLYDVTDVSTIPSPSTMSSASAVNYARPLTSDVMPPVSFDDKPVDQPFTAYLQPSSSPTYLNVDVSVEAGAPV